MTKSMNKKGVTLLELTIVLALLDIIVVMILSFCVIVQRATIVITYDNQTLGDQEDLSNALKTWLNSIDSDEYYLEVSDNKHIIYAKSKVGNKAYTFTYFSEFNSIVYTIPTNILYKKKYINCDVNFVDQLEFNIVDHSTELTIPDGAENNCLLIDCKLTFRKVEQVLDSPYVRHVIASTRCLGNGSGE